MIIAARRFAAAMLLCCLAYPAGAVPAFPGAIGFGAATPGGRGGRVMYVTSLADSGAGTLRACIDAVGARTCIFRVGGVIRFTTTRPVIRNPYLTIAGQTAPGGGILLAHAGGANGFTPLLIKGTHDIVVRHIRVRPDRRGSFAGGNDAFTIENSRNVILDHVSGSWALDENVNGYGNNDLLTISWSIFAEGIPKHDKCALLVSDPTTPQRISFIGNLCAHNGDRNPDINAPSRSCIEVLNNVLYNAESQFAEIWETYGGSPVNIVGNYFKAGADTTNRFAAIDREVIGSTGQAKIYQADNVVDGRMGLIAPRAQVAIVARPVCAMTIQPLSGATTYTKVLDTAGAFPRDSFDQRIIREVRTGTGRIVTAPGPLPLIANGTPYADYDRDGMSDAFERANRLDLTHDDGSGDIDRDGWTNLDEFLDYASQRVLAGLTVE